MLTAFAQISTQVWAWVILVGLAILAIRLAIKSRGRLPGEKGRKIRALVVAKDRTLRLALDRAFRTSGLSATSSETLREGLDDSLGRWKTFPQVIFFENGYDFPYGVVAIYDSEIKEENSKVPWGKVKAVVVSLRIGIKDPNYEEVRLRALRMGFDECIGRNPVGNKDEIIAPEEVNTVLVSLGLRSR
ncbi:MAG: hypothetical protein NTW60_00020 [Candidatus Wolfebacteria bacterium]|nr:hypothetical protein [Candidatus Wolfebacteria bacterium]